MTALGARRAKNLAAYMTHHRLTPIDLAEKVELDVNRIERALQGDFNSDALAMHIEEMLGLKGGWLDRGGDVADAQDESRASHDVEEMPVAAAKYEAATQHTGTPSQVSYEVRAAQPHPAGKGVVQPAAVQEPVGEIKAATSRDAEAAENARGAGAVKLRHQNLVALCAVKAVQKKVVKAIGKPQFIFENYLAFRLYLPNDATEALYTAFNLGTDWFDKPHSDAEIAQAQDRVLQVGRPVANSVNQEEQSMPKAKRSHNRAPAYTEPPKFDTASYEAIAGAQSMVTSHPPAAATLTPNSLFGGFQDSFPGDYPGMAEPVAPAAPARSAKSGSRAPTEPAVANAEPVKRRPGRPAGSTNKKKKAEAASEALHTEPFVASAETVGAPKATPVAPSAAVSVPLDIPAPAPAARVAPVSFAQPAPAAASAASAIAPAGGMSLDFALPDVSTRPIAHAAYRVLREKTSNMSEQMALKLLTLLSDSTI